MENNRTFEENGENGHFADAKGARQNGSRKKHKANKPNKLKLWWRSFWAKYRGLPKWLQQQIPVFVSMGVLAIFALSTILAMPLVEKQILESKQNRSGWPSRVVAPFVDMSSWVTSSAYAINGAPNLGAFADDTGVKEYNLGFINPLTNKPTNSDGSINWGWGGYSDLTSSSTNSQYLGIVQSMKNLTDRGGKYTISFGGQAGDAAWKVTQNVDKLAEFYADVITTYSLARIDLDIEESNQDADQNRANAKAIKRVQDDTNVEVVLTIPIMPSGWETKQINIIKAYLEEGVKIAMINSMCMCYGTGVASGEDYGDATIRAMENSVKQMQTIYANYGIDLTENEAYALSGCTVSIGYESSLYPTFTTAMMQKVADHAKNKGYGMLTFWSMGRDSQIESNSGIGSQYAYTKIALQYLEG